MISFLFSAGIVLLGSQSYVPPPPPSLPAGFSEEEARKGQALFERNVWIEGPIEIHNYLGQETCASCHDSKTPLKPESLAKGFSTLRDKINEEIVVRGSGVALPPQDPAMEALVQFLTKKYRLYEYKLSK